MSEMPVWATVLLVILGFVCLVIYPAILITLSILSTSDSYEAREDTSGGPR